ncbi:DUF2939 domain-containing protein [Hyphomicrobium sulfonivorans]|uniref:DUF2939 domain-containing protein n=1 Tax=Hyphomicrobium sulfonivorans TaxID=121290 RepID=UPI000839A710|nr:DUF2939 domain-containing protein [Hyphomicrobium sulfonivorans]
MVGGYILYARQAAINLQIALQEKDAARASSHIEWPSLRESLKEMFGALMQEQLRKPSSDNELEQAGEALAATLGPVLVNGMIDTYVNPTGLERLLSDSALADGPAGKVKKFDASRVKSYRVVSPTRYEIGIGEAPGPDPEFAIVMELRRLSWMVTGIIPKKPIAELAASTGM